MAVVNIKSTSITNADATPLTLSNPQIARGQPVESIAAISMGASDSANSTYRVCRISSSARLSSLQVANDANTGGTSYKAGVLLTAADGGGTAVSNSDGIFFSAVTMASARANFTELLSPAIAGNSASVANMEKRVWELLGLSADPYKVYDLAVTAVTPGSAGGNLAVKAVIVQ